MTAQRRTRLVDCNPRWATASGGTSPGGVSFACPEGHDGCRHVVPFTPALDGSPSSSWQANGCIWQRTGDTFETLTLSPSIRREPAADVQPGDPPSFRCAFHGFIRDGQIEFCGDSR